MTKTNPGFELILALVRSDQKTYLRNKANIRKMSLAKYLREVIDRDINSTKLK